MNTQTQSAKTTSYFNLHTTGIGYLNSVRTIEPKKGGSYVACRIAALVGESSAPEYRYFNVNVNGEENEKLISRCQEAVAARKKVLISFVLGDLWADTYVVDKDTNYHKKGDTVVSLKARLIRIKSIKVDGELKYTEPKKQLVEDAPTQE